MKMFDSRLKFKGDIELPKFSGIRVMMMPFHLHDASGSLPDSVRVWANTVAEICRRTTGFGVGYLTIDEAVVKTGETHRRPGLHVDGVGADGGTGGWGGGGGYAGQDGMYMVSSHAGCRAWNQSFEGFPSSDGDASHLSSQRDHDSEVTLNSNELWWCSSLCVHEAIAMEQDTSRQFCRVSMPSAAPWHEGYTENPLGIKPSGPIMPRRAEYMAYRP